LYHPGARFIPTARPGENDDLAPQMLDVDSFFARVESYFPEHGFYENEIARRTEQFGRIAHVLSMYESRHNPNDPEPFMRSIKSIQLFDDGNRCWIVTIYWQQENLVDPIPAKHIKSA
jgi:hypothetical protein